MTPSNVNDLLLLIGAWGPCASCAEDVFPLGGCGDEIVDVNDLLFMVGLWGPCAGCGAGQTEAPKTLNECWEKCTEKYPDQNSQEWAACYERCAQSLSERGLLEE